MKCVEPSIGSGRISCLLGVLVHFGRLSVRDLLICIGGFSRKLRNTGRKQMPRTAPDTSRHTQAGLAPLASGARSAGVHSPEESKRPESPGASGGLKAKAKTSEPEEESESSEEPSAPEEDEEADYERPRSPTPVPPRKLSRSQGRSHERHKKSSRGTTS